MGATEDIRKLSIMSYITLTKQFKQNLQTKIVRYIKDELKGCAILFDQKFYIEVDADEKTRWICEGITEDGQLFGRADWGETLGDDIEWDIYGLDVEVLAHLLDQLLEVNYTVLHDECVKP